LSKTVIIVPSPFTRLDANRLTFAKKNHYTSRNFSQAEADLPGALSPPFQNFKNLNLKSSVKRGII
jgi:hypothetical protein